MRPDLCHIHYCIINILCNNWNPTPSKRCLYLCFLGYRPLDSSSRLHQVELLFTCEHWALRSQSVPTWGPWVDSTSPSPGLSQHWLPSHQYQECRAAVLIHVLMILSSVKFVSPNCYHLWETV